MEIEYLREMRQNYLMISVEGMQDQGYEARMMIGNTIEGLLKFRIKKTDNHSRFCYEITSKQPLSRMLETKSINAVQIRRLLLGIARTLTKMEDYLLTEEQILLDPDYIYVNPDEYQPFLCLIPGKKGNFPDEFSLFLQFLLGKVDHQDKEAVVLTYGLYRESLKENYGLDNLLRWLMKENCPDIDSISESEECETITKEKIESWREDESERPEPIFQAGGKKPWYYYTAPGGIMLALSVGAFVFGGASVFMRYGLWLMAAGFGLSAAGMIIYAGWNLGLPWVHLFHESSSQNHTSCASTYYNHISYNQTSSEETWEDQLNSVNSVKSYTPQSVQNTGKTLKTAVRPDQRQSVFEKFQEEDSPEFSARPVFDTDKTETVPLWEPKEAKAGRSLVSEDGVGRIPVVYYPFIIGRLEGFCDYVISRDTVSRLHLRIDETKDGYQITDLNSDNGTYINGRCLNANETAAVQPGDEVGIADLKFHFK